MEMINLDKGKKTFLKIMKLIKENKSSTDFEKYIRNFVYDNVADFYRKLEKEISEFFANILKPYRELKL